jgi:ribonuclease BN (tRNA processing enzyme)
MGPRELLSGEMMAPYFPATLEQMAGITAYSRTPLEPFSIGSATVSCARLCHPGVTYGYRIEADGATFVYISDDEADGATADIMAGMLALAGDADLLLHDCQYFEDEYPSKRGWGHSTPRMAVGIAREAAVRHLVLFHHDPSHADEQVEAMAAEARRWGDETGISIAQEGTTVQIEPRVARIESRTAVREG